MYLLYLDDSGSASNRNEEYVVIGGIAVPEASVHWLTGQLESLIARLCPAGSGAVEFHASECLKGKTPPWNKLQRDERLRVIKSVLRVLENSHSKMPVFACAVHKKSFPNNDPIELAFEDLTSRFDMFLNRLYHEKKERHRGIIVFDNTSYEAGLQNLAISFRNSGTKWRRLTTICEVPFFVDSKASRIIQLADHIAYAVFKMYEREDLRFFNTIQSRFDTEGGIIHGLVHKQYINPNCTCPGCLTRTTVTALSH